MMPKKRPTLPGDFIKEDILNEFELTQEQLADELGVSRRTINELVKGKRRITADMALRLGKFTKTNPEVWMNLQNIVDLWDVAHSKSNAKFLRQIQPCVA
ncbi:MAG: HigA family addiction module antidote protein [Deltaproteobacteria bacterium]|nr:HigA family addiction module antidote protein [Deltaproteobacteria bacterium]